MYEPKGKFEFKRHIVEERKRQMYSLKRLHALKLKDVGLTRYFKAVKLQKTVDFLT